MNLLNYFSTHVDLNSSGLDIEGPSIFWGQDGLGIQIKWKYKIHP